MTRQNKTTLPFILGGLIMISLAFAACNGSGDTKEAKKDSPVVVTPAPVVKDSTDTMEAKTGKVSPGTDVKPQ